MTMHVELNSSWKAHLNQEFEKDYFQNLERFVKGEYEKSACYPSRKLIFSAFDLCEFESVKVVILGQDPYHGEGQANGLCFSVNDGVTIPPSLKNIFKEIESDMGKPIPHSGNLIVWADQGVLLLNATLTVRANQAGSHQKKGWELFSDAVIRELNNHRENIVFMLWGNYAQKKGAFIDTSKHLVLKSAHPSPLSAYNGFFGNKHFSKANAYLTDHSKSAINW